MMFLIVMRHLAWSITTSVFAKVDLESSILLTTSDALNRFDGVCDVGKINESATLLSQCIDKLNLSVIRKVLPKPFLTPRFVKISNVNIP